VVAESHASIGPGVEVSVHVDGTAHALALADGPKQDWSAICSCMFPTMRDTPVLVEGLSAVDRWLVVTGGLVKIVCAPVVVCSTLELCLGARVVGAVVLNNVVLHLTRISEGMRSVD
jgi:hypothetical protein